MKDRPSATALQYWVYTFNLEEPPMTAWGEERYKAAKPSSGTRPYPLSETNDPVYKGCVPSGVPRIFPRLTKIVLPDGHEMGNLQAVPRWLL